MSERHMGYAKYEDGQIITTISGSKRLKTFCVACSEPVHFVKEHTRNHPSKGKICVKAHFRHTNAIHQSTEFLRQHHPESIAHRVAKQAIVEGNFYFYIRCTCTKIISIKLAGERKEEVPYSKYVLDVAYLNGDTVVGGVEVLHSSRVSDRKVRYLDKNIPWCEVKAEDVLKSTGRIFAERSHNQICDSCKRIQECRVAAREKRILREKIRQEEEKIQQEEKRRIEEEKRKRERLEQEEQKRLKREREEEKRKQEEQEARNRYVRRTLEGEWKKFQEEMDPFKELLL